MNRLTLLWGTILLLFLPPVEAEGQSRPQLPLNPTIETCNAFRDQYSHHLNALRAEVSACTRGKNYTADWESVDVCAAIRIKYPPECTAPAAQSGCDHRDFGDLINECMRLARAGAAAPESDLSKEILTSPTEGVSGVATRNLMRLGNLLAGQGEASVGKSLVAANGAAFHYGRRGYRSLMAMGGSTADRLDVLMDLAGKSTRNPLARDMLDTAIKGLMATNSAALNTLIDDLERVSLQIGQEQASAIRAAVERAKAEAERRAAARIEADLPQEDDFDSFSDTDDFYEDPGAYAPTVSACQSHSWYQSCLSGEQLCMTVDPRDWSAIDPTECCQRNLWQEFGISCP